MILKFEIADGHEGFNFSVVGKQKGESGGIEIPNTFGWISAGCEEYARRAAVRLFKRQYPTAEVLLVGLTKLDEHNFAEEKI